jgi:hypothetical protein
VAGTVTMGAEARREATLDLEALDRPVHASTEGTIRAAKKPSESDLETPGSPSADDQRTSADTQPSTRSAPR